MRGCEEVIGCWGEYWNGGGDGFGFFWGGDGGFGGGDHLVWLLYIGKGKLSRLKMESFELFSWVQI